MEYSVTKEGLEDFAGQFWQLVRDAKLFAFHGPMGAGKTTIITALCHKLGTTDTVASPTFSIINQYSFYHNGEEDFIYHIDLYRLRDPQEVVDAGVEDCLYSGSVCMVEWPEKAPQLFDDNTVHVQVEPVSETVRRIIVNLPSPL
jgi:tRNA threonylcarbamoyladenosine biosynthesis protein TsaE